MAVATGEVAAAIARVTTFVTLATGAVLAEMPVNLTEDTEATTLADASMLTRRAFNWFVVATRLVEAAIDFPVEREAVATGLLEAARDLLVACAVVAAELVEAAIDFPIERATVPTGLVEAAILDRRVFNCVVVATGLVEAATGFPIERAVVAAGLVEAATGFPVEREVVATGEVLAAAD
jgi:hypothetical protein